MAAMSKAELGLRLNQLNDQFFDVPKVVWENRQCHRQGYYLIKTVLLLENYVLLNIAKHWTSRKI